MSEGEAPVYEGWAILELMGHRRLAGKVTEAVVAGKSFIRIDVHTSHKHPDLIDGEVEEHVATQFYSPDAVYCLTPSTEELCREMGDRARPAPVRRYELEPPRSDYEDLED